MVQTFLFWSVRWGCGYNLCVLVDIHCIVIFHFWRKKVEDVVPAVLVSCTKKLR